MLLCREQAYQKAFIRLIESGFGPSDAPSVWRYLFRQVQSSNNIPLSNTILQRMTEDGEYPPEYVYQIADEAMASGDFAKARALITSAAGDVPADLQVLTKLFRAMERNDPDGAAALIAPHVLEGEDTALLLIDLLRRKDMLTQARAAVDKAIGRFGKTPRLSLRLARILEGFQNWQGALGVCEDLADASPFDDAELLLRMIWLQDRLQHLDDRDATIVRLLTAQPTVLHFAELAEILGDTSLLEVAIARHCTQAAPNDTADETLVADLLNGGYVGMARYVIAARAAAGTALPALLDEAARGQKWSAVSSQIALAAQQRAPACLLPLPPETQIAQAHYSFDPASDTILIVNASMTAGGAERQLVVMVSALIEQGVAPEQIHVALYSIVGDRGQDHFLADLQALDVTIHDLRREAAGATQDGELHYRTALLPAAMRRDVAMLTPLVRKLRPKVLHAWQDRPSLSAGWVAAHQVVPRLVMSARNMSPPMRLGAPVKVDRLSLRALAKLPNTVLTVNSVNGARDYEAWLDRPAFSAKVLSNGILLPDVPKPRKSPRKPIHVHGVFRFSPAKRPILWLDTIVELQKRSDRTIVPILYGNGPLEQEIAHHAAAIGVAGLQIITGEKDPRVIYGGADFVLLMSQIEGTPNVLLEAQAAGVAVAGCDVGGTKDAMLDPGGHPGAGSMLFPVDVKATDAAEALVAWLPNALNGAAADRHNFVKDNFSVAALGRTVLEYYSQPPEDQT